MFAIGPREGKILTFDIVSRNRLYYILKNYKYKRKKNDSRVLEVTPGGFPYETKFKY